MAVLVMQQRPESIRRVVKESKTSIERTRNQFHRNSPCKSLSPYPILMFHVSAIERTSISIKSCTNWNKLSTFWINYAIQHGVLRWGRGCDTARPPVSASPPPLSWRHM